MIYPLVRKQLFQGPRYVRTRPDRNLRRFAEETGGYFELTEADELGPTFTRVAQELHSPTSSVLPRANRMENYKR
ncbi:MAG: hypothetical protein CM1200mP25_4840 [Acidobacteriota bacterium]|nr:MAG: hypothetical protein CM1200mP25_4840 [Acidobacteriota bacterium]